MSDMLNAELQTIVAVGLGANKGFWMIQPRDDEGQWIEMGADVLFRFRTGEGNLVVGTGRGVYVGPGGKPGVARVMVKSPGDSGLKSGVYEIDSRNLQQFKAIIPDSDGGSTAGSRKDKFGNPVKTLEEAKLPDVKALLETRKDITEDDERLGRGELTPEEKEAEQSARAESPIADLPAGFEAENPEEVKSLLRDMGVELDGDAPKAAPKRDIIDSATDYKGRTGKDVVKDKVPPKDYLPPQRDPSEFRPFDGSGMVPDSVRRENARKSKDRGLLERELGRKLTPDEVSALGLTLEDTSPMGYGRREYQLVDFDNKEQMARIDKALAKNAAIRKQILDELDGKTTSAEDAAKDVKTKEAYLDSFDGKKVDLDQLESESLALAREINRETESKSAIDLDRGDILVGPDGLDYVVTDIRASREGDDKVNITIQTPNGKTASFDYGIDKKFDVVKNKRGTIGRPARPSRRPDTADQVDAPNTPEVEETEEVIEEPSDPIDLAEDVVTEAEDSDGLDLGELVQATDQGLAPRNFPPSDRMDDGSEFELPVLTPERLEEARSTYLVGINGPDGVPVKYLDQYNMPQNADDPFAMLDALSKVYPNSKFTPDGALVLHRQKDKDGRIFELRASNSGKRAIIYSMRWTDPATGEYKEYLHKDDRHSIKSLFTDSNGPQGLLDRLLGRVDSKGKDWGDPENYKFGNKKWKRDDSLFNRVKWFMSGKGDRKKMESIDELATRFAEGSQAIYHDEKDMILKHQELPSFWDSFKDWFDSGPDRASRDAALREDMYHVLYSVFGRIPMDEKSHSIAKKALRRKYRELFAGSSARQRKSFDAIITAASERMRGIYREPDSETRAIKYASKDRTRAIETGQVVEYTNNVGEKSILKVDALVENVSARPTDSASYDYGDYVIAVDANGNKVTLNALKLRILSNKEMPLSAYRVNLRGEALAKRRREIEGIPEPDPTMPPSAIRPGIDWDTIAPPVGTRTLVTDPPPAPMLIDDFVTGDMLYNKNGEPLGIIKASPRPIKSRDGSPGLAFLYTKANGTEGTAIYKLGTEITPKKA